MNSCNCNQGLAPVNEHFFCPRMQAYIVRGPRGETGAQGPQGPQGLNGIIDNNITLATPQEVGVIAQGATTFTQIVTQNGADISIAVGESAVALTRGTYLVVYNLSGLNADADSKTYRFAISLGGEVQTSLESTATVAQNQVATLGGNGIINVANDEVLTLVNNTDSPAEISNLVMSIVKLM